MGTHAQALSTLVDGILGGGIRVVDLTVPLDAVHFKRSVAARNSLLQAFLARGDLALRLAGPRLVLE